ncbi:MAG: GNAT family N-acetyltransferase [Oscillospiraceae bacterium]|nr:GNAT family N-acetyltransferase [Oscillospiraceae bacterium]
MYLETERLALRDFTMGDLWDLHEIFSDPEAMKNTEPPYSLERTTSFLKEFCVNPESKNAFAVVLKEAGKVIGYVLFMHIDEPEIFETGWIFNKDYWRQGYAYEICSELIRHGFEDIGLHKICAEAIDEKKSVSLMKKLGMQSEGIQRKHSRNGEGDWCDLYRYAILAEDYNRVQ